MRIWSLINSIGLILISAILYLVIRQLGLVLGRMGPIGARSTDTVGPRVGENVDHHVSSLLLPNSDTSKKYWLYVFGSDACSICKRVKEAVPKLHKYWKNKVEFILIYDKHGKNDTAARDENNSIFSLIRDDTLKKKLAIGPIPFGVITDNRGVVLGKGLVNNMSNLESLLELIPDNERS